MPHSEESFWTTDNRIACFSGSLGSAASAYRKHLIAAFFLMLSCLAALSFSTQTLAQVSPPMAPVAAPYLDANGWTVFTPSADTRVVYVSSSQGNDNNDGLSQSTPVKTIKKGLALIRHNYPDWLLLKKGDVWNDEAFEEISGVNNGTARSGRSSAEPMLLSAYGTGARPLIKTNPKIHGTIIGSSGGGGGQGGNYIAIVGIEFYAYTRDPNSPNYDFGTTSLTHVGINFLLPIDWMLIEDCKWSFYQNNVIQTVGGTSQNVSLRRNVIANNYSTNSHAQGLYTENIVGLLLEENLFDHNGWNEQVAGAEPTIFNHNLYLQYQQGPATVRGNIITWASSHGIQARSGGSITDNLFARNSITILSGGLPATITGNAILEGKDIDVATPRGMAIDLNPATGPSTVTRNIIAHAASSPINQRGIALAASTTGIAATNNIIYDWLNAIVDQGSGNTTSPNDINLGGYPDPTRSIASYNASLGGASTLAAFLAEARLQSKDNWRPQYTAAAVNSYIRSGFTTAAAPVGGGSSGSGSTTGGSNGTVATITTPTNGGTLKGNGNVNISVVADDPSGVATISIMADGVVLQTCKNAKSCSTTWQGKNIKQGTHTITAIAVGITGNQGKDAVTVSALR